MRVGPVRLGLLYDPVPSCGLCPRRRARTGARWARGGAGEAGRADGSPHVRAGRRSAATGGGCCRSRGAPRGGSARVTRRSQSPRGRPAGSTKSAFPVLSHFTGACSSSGLPEDRHTPAAELCLGQREAARAARGGFGAGVRLASAGPCEVTGGCRPPLTAPTSGEAGSGSHSVGAGSLIGK